MLIHIIMYYISFIIYNLYTSYIICNYAYNFKIYCAPKSLRV